MSGPCLCGDPHCAKCGNPSAAEMEQAYDYLDEQDIHSIRQLEIILPFFKKLYEMHKTWLGGQYYMVSEDEIASIYECLKEDHVHCLKLALEVNEAVQKYQDWETDEHFVDP